MARDAFQVRRLVLRNHETFEMNFDTAVPVAIHCVRGTCNVTDSTTAIDLEPGQTLRGEAKSLYVQRPSEWVVLIIVSES